MLLEKYGTNYHGISYGYARNTQYIMLTYPFFIEMLKDVVNSKAHMSRLRPSTFSHQMSNLNH